MPYIKQEQRDEIQFSIAPKDAGEFNYLITELAIQFLHRNGKPRYQDMNDIIGALEGCKLELYRRLVAPYEDQKIYENGDVYPNPITGEPANVHLQERGTQLPLPY